MILSLCESGVETNLQLHGGDRKKQKKKTNRSLKLLQKLP